MRKSAPSAAAPGPTKAVVVFVEGVSKKDVVELARGYAQKFFASPNTSRYCILPFMTGWLYEVHEANAGGRRGKGHLSSIVAALNGGQETAWFRVDGRVFSVSIKDARPYGVLLAPQAGAALVKSAPECEVSPTDAMHDVVNKGEKVLAFGMTVFTIGAMFLGGALGYDIMTKINVPVISNFSVTDAPHRQWERVAQTPKGLYVDALRFDKTKPDGQQWSLSRKPVARTETPVVIPAPFEPAAVSMPAVEPVPIADPTSAQPEPGVGQ